MLTKLIEEIAVYTLETWGEEQTKTYLEKLYVAFTKIASDHQLGRHRRDIQEGVYSQVHEQHTIFYRKKGDDVVILRILHQSRDVQRAFT